MLSSHHAGVVACRAILDDRGLGRVKKCSKGEDGKVTVGLSRQPRSAFKMADLCRKEDLCLKFCLISSSLANQPS